MKDVSGTCMRHIHVSAKPHNKVAAIHTWVPHPFLPDARHFQNTCGMCLKHMQDASVICANVTLELSCTTNTVCHKLNFRVRVHILPCYKVKLTSLLLLLLEKGQTAKTVEPKKAITITKYTTKDQQMICQLSNAWSHGQVCLLCGTRPLWLKVSGEGRACMPVGLKPLN